LRQPAAILTQTAPPLNPQQACPCLSQRKQLNLKAENWTFVLFHSANRPSLFGVCFYVQRARCSHNKGKPFLILIMLHKLEFHLSLTLIFLFFIFLDHFMLFPEETAKSLTKMKIKNNMSKHIYGERRFCQNLIVYHLRFLNDRKS